MAQKYYGQVLRAASRNDLRHGLYASVHDQIAPFNAQARNGSSRHRRTSALRADPTILLASYSTPEAAFASVTQLELVYIGVVGKVLAEVLDGLGEKLAGLQMPCYVAIAGGARPIEREVDHRP
jgi:hypothetical protein